MLSLAQWYLWAQLLSLSSLSISLLVFRRLPDRGYPLSKSLGLLLPAFVLWIGGSLHLWPNTLGTLLLIWGVLLAVGLVVVWRRWGEVAAFFREQRWLVLVTELLFAAALVLWAVVRAYNPDILSAEKPMDMGLLNAVVRNRYFPPADPWLSGYTVNYYYFGFVAASLPLRLAGVPPAIGYNLALAYFFALTALGAFSLVFNLVKLTGARWRVAVGVGLAGAASLLLVANLEGALEFAYSRGWGGGGLWRWVGIDGLDRPYMSPTWHPTQGVWWWHATRVISSWQGGTQTDMTITEFPFFSFLFGDLHAHVMVLPLSLVVLGLGLAVVAAPQVRGPAWARREPLTFLALPLALGALGVTNAWNLPPFLVVAAGCLFLRWGLGWRQWLLAGVMAAGAILLYLPFYLTYSSPATIVLPWLGPGSRLWHFFLVWGLWLWLVLPFLVRRMRRGASGTVTGAFLGVVLAPFLMWAAIVLGLGLLAGSPAAALGRVASRLWLLGPVMALAIIALMGALSWLSWGKKNQPLEPAPAHPNGEERSSAYAELLVFVALFLLLGAELFYTTDMHGNRVNTVFKLSYQSWLLLSVAATFAVYHTAVHWRGQRWGRWGRRLWWGTAVLLLAGSLYYPPAAAVSISGGFSRQPTMDGLAYLSRAQPSERAAMEWLRQQPGTPVVVEAVGEDYTQYGRVSAFTGLPTLLAWPDHQRQWRGTVRPWQGRREAVERLYTSPDRQEVISLLARYSVKYVYVGELERRRYGRGAGENLRRFLEVAFEPPGVTVYRVP